MDTEKIFTKNSLIIPALFLFLLSFVSAQFYGGFTDFLSGIDPNAMTLGVLFIVLFAILFFSLSRVFKDKYGYPNKTIASVVSLALSVLSVYWINKTGFDITELVYSIGISEEILYIIAPLIVLAGLIFLFTRFKTKRFGKTLLILGGLLFVLSFTDLVYEKEFLTIGSIIMIVLGLVMIFRRARGSQGFSRNPKQWRPQRPGREPRPRRAPRPWRAPKPRRAPRGREGPIGPRGPPGPTGEGEIRGATPGQVKERLKQERRAEKEQQERLQIEQRQQKQIGQQERLQISDVPYLIKTYNEIQIQYNNLQKQNPSDPRLADLQTKLMDIASKIKSRKKR